MNRELYLLIIQNNKLYHEYYELVIICKQIAKQFINYI